MPKTFPYSKTFALHTSIVLAVFVSIFLLLYPTHCQAAHVYFDTTTYSYGNQQFSFVDVYLDTQDAHINAIEGSITIPEVATILHTAHADSVMSLWIERPSIATSSITFTGGIFNGYQGDAGKLFSFILHSQQNTSLAITGSGRSALHDGLGTLVATTFN